MRESIPDPLHEEPDQPATLLDAVNRLSGHVVRLTDRLDVSVKQARTTRWLVAAVAAIMVVGAFLGGYLFLGLHHQVQSSQADAVTSCQNQNEARHANLALWNFLLDSSEAKATDQQRVRIEKIRSYVSVLFEDHDCSDLSRNYPIPDPPSLAPTG